MADEEIIKLIGEFYFKRGYYEESLELFKAIENSSEEDYSYWEKNRICISGSQTI